MFSEWSKTIFVRFALAFADDTADDGILPFKDPLGSGNSNFSLVGRKYFKIDIVPKTRAKLIRAYKIFSLIITLLVEILKGYLVE